MMKILTFNGEQFKAEKIIKTQTDIIGQNPNGIEIFSFKGISDFSSFILEEEQTFDTEEPTQEEILSKELAYIKVDNMKKDVMMTNALKVIADLRVEVMSLKGGNV